VAVRPSAGAAPAENRHILLVAYAGAVAALTGVQLITPALPAIQRGLDLSDSQVGLVTSLFLLPGLVLSVPIGFLTDRVGRRSVFCVALVLMGAGGVVLLVVHDTLVLFVVRLLQGVAFAALLPTTITLIGDVVKGSKQIRAQGNRNMVMAMGEASLPLIGGALVGLAWFAPFAVQVLAIPLAIIGWKVIGPRRTTRHYRTTLRSLGRLLRDGVAVAIQLAGMLRFLFRFALLSYLPILLDARDASPLLISVSLSSIAVAGILSAWAAPSIVGRARPSAIVALCLFTMSMTLAAVAVIPAHPIAIAAMVLFGFADMLYGVVQNAAMVTVVKDEARASFVAAIGAVRNFGKFAAPTLIGVLLLGLRLEQAFLIIAAVALLAIPTALPFRTIDDRLSER
jgi:MFS transporter, ACDE family, multidrug resistance protein